MEEVFTDFRTGALKSVYNYIADLPPIESVGPARRSIYKRDLYYYKGVQMVDLVHASRGCRFNCYPCAVAYLGGRKFRPRPIDKAIEEIALVDNNRLFVVDNSLAQDTQWELDLFREMIPLKKNWCSHTIEDKPEVLDMARQAGAWYVYQAVFDTSDFIKERIKRYHDHDIAVEGTILLGMDNHDEEYVKRLIDFLLEIDLDRGIYRPHTVSHTKAGRHGQAEADHRPRWNNYNAGRVVYRPKLLSPGVLQELYYFAWSVYQDEPQQYKMFRLIQKVVERATLGTLQAPAARPYAAGLRLGDRRSGSSESITAELE